MQNGMHMPCIILITYSITIGSLSCRYLERNTITTVTVNPGYNTGIPIVLTYQLIMKLLEHDLILTFILTY